MVRDYHRSAAENVGIGADAGDAAVTASPFHAVAPVSAVCAAFRTQPSTYPPSTRKPDVAPTCGSVGEKCSYWQEGQWGKPLAANAGTRRNGQNRGVLGAAARKRRESGEKAGQSRGVVRAPQRSHLPAVRAVSGIYEGVPNTAKNSRRALRNEKSPPFQGKQRGSNEKHEVNTEKW